MTLSGATLTQQRLCCLHREGLSPAAHYTKLVGAEPSRPGSLAQGHGSPSTIPQAWSLEVSAGLLTIGGEGEATHLALLRRLNLGQCLLGVGLQQVQVGDGG